MARKKTTVWKSVPARSKKKVFEKAAKVIEGALIREGRKLSLFAKLELSMNQYTLANELKIKKKKQQGSSGIIWKISLIQRTFKIKN